MTTMMKAPASMKAGLGGCDADFVATYIPADMQWRRDYQRLIQEDALPEGSRLADFLEDRLGWETFAETTFRGRLGATIERLGVAIAHVDADKVQGVANALAARLVDEVGPAWREVGLAELRLFLLGMLDHMRSQGAVVTPITRMFVQREARWIAVLKGFAGGRNSLPNYAPASPKPVFPANVSLSGFETCFSESSASWYSTWFNACFGKFLTLDPDIGDFFGRVFDLLESHRLVERLRIGGKSEDAVAAWGLVPEHVLVFSTTSLVRCSACGNSHRVPEKYAALWKRHALHPRRLRRPHEQRPRARWHSHARKNADQRADQAGHRSRAHQHARPGGTEADRDEVHAGGRQALVPEPVVRDADPGDGDQHRRPLDADPLLRAARAGQLRPTHWPGRPAGRERAERDRRDGAPTRHVVLGGPHRDDLRPGEDAWGASRSRCDPTTPVRGLYARPLGRGSGRWRRELWTRWRGLEGDQGRRP